MFENIKIENIKIMSIHYGLETFSYVLNTIYDVYNKNRTNNCDNVNRITPLSVGIKNNNIKICDIV